MHGRLRRHERRRVRRLQRCLRFWTRPGPARTPLLVLAESFQVNCVAVRCIVFIALGTGDQYDWRTFDATYRRLIEYALANAVLPVVWSPSDAA